MLYIAERVELYPLLLCAWGGLALYYQRTRLLHCLLSTPRSAVTRNNTLLRPSTPPRPALRPTELAALLPRLAPATVCL